MYNMTKMVLRCLVANIVIASITHAFTQYQFFGKIHLNSPKGIIEQKSNVLSKPIYDHQHQLFGSSNVDDQLDSEIDAFIGSGLHPDVTSVKSRDDFFEFLSKDDRICVVKFYASWCKTCKKFDQRFRKYAMKEGDKLDRRGKIVKSGRVRFAEVELKQNLRLCKSLGIKKLPYIHYYKAGIGKIDDYVCLPKNFQKLIEDVESFLDMSDEEINLEKKLREGGVLGDSLVADLKQTKTIDYSSFESE